MTSAPRPSLEDVLDAFAAESHTAANILATYLGKYPEYAEDLVDLSREINRTVLEEGASLSSLEQERIVASRRRFFEVTPKAVDPLAALSVSELRDIATSLGVKRQVLAAFREHRVILDSVPARFLARLAAEAKTTLEALVGALTAPLELSPARSYKSEATPENGGPVTFERLLMDAGHSEEERAALMSKDE